MLSRSNSNAGERLRRAKSTSSTHTSSSGHQRTRTSIDPYVTRQQAEVAAVEAYYRAHEQDESTCSSYREAHLRGQRRQGHVTGRSEGSHLQDARLGRRKSTSRKENHVRVKPNSIERSSQYNEAEHSIGDGIVQTRRRFVVPPNPSISQYDCPALPSSNRQPRSSEQGYGDGSPIPRKSSTYKDRSSTVHPHAPLTAHSDGYSDNLSKLSEFGSQDDGTGETIHALRAPTSETQTNGDIVAMTRDKCLQDFHQHKLRERKSFILAPFQKQRAATMERSMGSNYDTKLPPFNHANERSPPPPPLAIAVPSTTVHSEKKDRHFSDTLKRRFRKVFRKASRAPSGLPVQHIEAKHFRFSTTSSSLARREFQSEDDPFISVSERTIEAAREIDVPSTCSKDSTDERSVAKSRLTSWTNSTVAGTWSTRGDGENTEPTGEHGMLRRSDSLSTLRKSSSFFGRALKNKLRRPGKAELRSSDESTALYSALQERIEPLPPSGHVANSDEGSHSATSALATLPSQHRASSTMSNKGRWGAPTIRSVTPDPAAYKLDIPSPVTEVLSPVAADASSTQLSQREDKPSESTARSQLQRRPAMKAPTPSKEQIARRIEKSKNRWQSPLDELSPQAVRPTSAALGEDNPYELRSLSRTLRQPIENNDLPRHAKVAENTESARNDVLSPSVYSRGTDGSTPQPASPAERGDMMVTITSREVRSYSISPPKRTQREERPMQASSDWRRWLSNEMNGMDDSVDPDRFELPRDILADVCPSKCDELTKDEDCDEAETRDESDPAHTTLDKSKPFSETANDRSTAARKDKYRTGVEYQPLAGINRAPSARSKSQGRTVYSRATSQQNRAENQAVDRPIAVQEENLYVGNMARSTSNGIRPRLANHKSVSYIATTTQYPNQAGAQERCHGLENRDSCDEHVPLSVPSIPKDQVSNTNRNYKPKSAFDLRANYKPSTSSAAKPLPIRHRPSKNDNFHILEDTTIQNISAGPYASHHPSITSATVPTDANKENSSPSEVNAPLPVLSSSEWLAAGSDKKWETRKSPVQHSDPVTRSVSRNSPSRALTTIVPSRGSSPGQRLVTNWLDGKRSKEDSPAFV